MRWGMLEIMDTCQVEKLTCFVYRLGGSTVIKTGTD